MDRKYGYLIPDDIWKLKLRCFSSAHAMYGYPLPGIVQTRLDRELEAIAENKFWASDFLIASDLVDVSKKIGYPVCNRGGAGSSLVAYFCGISQVNPLPAHYYCPVCRRFELNDYYTLTGYDLPPKTCTCGKAMRADGINCLPEVWLGMNLEKEPQFAVNFASAVRPVIIAYLKETYGRENVFRAGVARKNEQGALCFGEHPGGVYVLSDGSKMKELAGIRDPDEDDGFQMPVVMRDYSELWDELKKYDLLIHPALDMLYRLENRTGFRSGEIRFDDKDVLQVFLSDGLGFIPSHGRTQLESGIIRMVQPTSFSELARIHGLVQGVGTWIRCGEELFSEGRSVSEMIAFRDDFMQYLMTGDMPKEQAYRIMNQALSHKEFPYELACAMRRTQIPEWLIKSCERITYAYPKCQAFEYTRINWQLGYYKLHYLEAYVKELARLDY